MLLAYRIDKNLRKQNCTKEKCRNNSHPRKRNGYVNNEVLEFVHFDWFLLFDLTKIKNKFEIKKFIYIFFCFTP